MTVAATGALTNSGDQKYSLPYVIAASSVGTMIEWYDFYLYGTLAALAGTLFFPPGNDTAAFLAASAGVVLVVGATVVTGAGATLGLLAVAGAPAGAVGETGTVVTAAASDNNKALGNSATTISPAI